jgi:O-antigen/teichoic acid export membrane protein
MVVNYLKTFLSKEKSTLKKQALNGAIWTVIGYGGSQVIRFASNLVLTRLLFPELFGLMGIVNLFIMGLALFSDVGIGYNIIQNKEGDEPEFYNTAWTIQIVRGFLLWIACLGIAIPISHLYNLPELATLIPIVGFTSVISGFFSTSLYTLERHLDLKKKVLLEISIQAFGISVMLIWAFVSPSIWALVAGGLASNVIKLIWSHRLVPEMSNHFLWSKRAVEEIFSIGRWVLVSTGAMFLAEQADRLMLGAMFPIGLFGIYQIALTLADVPRQVISSLSGKVIFPSVSKVIDQPQHIVVEKLLKSRKILLVPFLLMTAFLTGFGDIIIRFLYDERYSAGSWMLPILALGFWPRLLAQTSEPYLLARGLFKYPAFGNFLRLGFTVVGIAIGFYYFQEIGAIVAVALNDLLYYVVVTFGLAREKVYSIIQDIVVTATLISFLLVIFLVRNFFNIGMSF